MCISKTVFSLFRLAGQKLDFCVAIGLPEKCVTIMKDLMATEVIKVRLEQRLYKERIWKIIKNHENNLYFLVVFVVALV